MFYTLGNPDIWIQSEVDNVFRTMLREVNETPAVVSLNIWILTDVITSH